MKLGKGVNELKVSTRVVVAIGPNFPQFFSPFFEVVTTLETKDEMQRQICGEI